MAQGTTENESETVTAKYAEHRVLCTECQSKADGGVLTAKRAPRRPGTAPALGLRAGGSTLDLTSDGPRKGANQDDVRISPAMSRGVTKSIRNSELSKAFRRVAGAR